MQDIPCPGRQLYERIAEPFSIGWSHIRLARLVPTPAERNEHLEAAREAWKRIDRPDLIEGMEKEFNIRLTTAEVRRLTNVGDFITLIAKKRTETFSPPKNALHG